MPPSQRRRQPAAEESDDDEQNHNNIDEDGDETMGGGERDPTSELIKKMVRYALACEYSRTPIRRDGIKEKVLGPQGREFKRVFHGAQKQLRATFGMEMVELPNRDRNLMTAEQKRKAAKSQTQREATSNTYILVSLLPGEFRDPAIIPPSKVMSEDGEAAYMALYTTIISIIALSGGELSEPRLRRHLSRLNASDTMPSQNPNDPNAPSEKTEDVLQRMIKQGYLVKAIGAVGLGDNDEDLTTWHIGPRGKAEVTNEAIAEFVRQVYGQSDPDLESKLQRSLKVRARAEAENAEEPPEEEPGNGDPGPSSRRRSRRREAPEEEEEEEDDEEDE